MPTNDVIARAEFTLRWAPGTLGIFETSSCPTLIKTKKVLSFERGNPGTAPYGKPGHVFCITFIKKLDEGLR